ncbi:MAG: hypothetical protein M3347_07070 [Armatimonadota bacterium]|nr:hypothetical protein [Armatimonadota bacterium]
MEASKSAGLEVPGEPGVYWCARHRKVKTRLRCGRCETPICPKCTRMGPTGARCPDCASHRTTHIYQVSPLHYVLTFVAAAILSVIGAVLIQAIGFYIVFFAPVAGTMLAKAITFVTRGKRGTMLAIVASIGTVLGAVTPLGIMWLIAAGTGAQAAGAAGGAGVAAAMMLPQVGYVLLYLCLVIPSLWYWIK